jgi:chlorite dismutase
MAKDPDPIYMQILSFRFKHSAYMLSRENRADLVMQINSTLSAFRKNSVSLKIYRSIRYDADYMLWYSTHYPDNIADLLSTLREKSKGFLSFVTGFLSIYSESPYLNKGTSLEDTLNEKPGKYLVAYPMSKSNEWYQIPYEERKSIMAEHIGTALAHPDNKGIRSYTTYSFGISDSEFVVIYEVEDLAGWSRVTNKLREVKARKWITSETPILVGTYSDRVELGSPS